MCRAIAASFQNYAIAGRTLKQAYFKFRRHSLLVVASPTHEDGRLGPDHSLTFFVNAHAALPNLVHSARVFLAEHAAELD